MKFVKMLALAFTLLFLTQAVASAQGTTVAGPFSNLRELAVGLVIIGAAMGIGNLAKGAVESMARQPEIAGQLQITMIIAAALIEGATFFALIVIGFRP
jgi:F-type H+-transporting ATPase subunit c